MNDSLSQQPNEDILGYLAAFARRATTSPPRHIFSAQVQEAPPGLSLQLQTHLGEISLHEERLDPVCSRSRRGHRRHESENWRRAKQQRFHRGGGKSSKSLVRPQHRTVTRSDTACLLPQTQTYISLWLSAGWIIISLSEKLKRFIKNEEESERVKVCDYLHKCLLSVTSLFFFYWLNVWAGVK